MDELHQRVALLEDERAVERLLAAYGAALDYGDEAAWVGCFAVDGVFEVRRHGRDEPVLRVEGHEALLAFAEQHSRAPELWHKHLAVMPTVAVDGDTATSSSSMVLLVEHGGRPELGVFGRYVDELVRVEGRWVLRRRVAEIESRLAGIPALPYGRVSG